MSKLQLIVLVSYLLMTGYFFINWLRFSLRHPPSSPEDNFLSFVMFCIIVVFWPLVLPFSLIKMCLTREIELGTVFPAIAVIIAVSLSYYLS
ncbi:hypothetical protein [Calothrix sp. NIES-3974]|uniref:hypothetical protein n=1 Tax=Calothrix sp. NIES-3974 TaxID=2005462 RepID=UPI000B5F6079|nr:hypothetical protein [Calothrix sp. NIES-3974]BAZ08105.1 hypothetical protein NIES3974_47740 [Calothrix sp. NIES-3974]